MKLEIPRDEIALAVRTGFLTRKIWESEFAGNSKISWKYERWRNLTKRGYFLKHPSAYALDVIVPNAEHLVVQDMVGDFVAAPPSVAVLSHDERVIRTYLKLKSLTVLDFAKFETELKKEDLRNKRHFDPSDTTKYPDLLIGYRGPAGSRAIAIELELSRKEPKRYRQMMNSYMSNREVQAVLFLTDLDVVKNGIKTAIRETYYPSWERPVAFAKVQEFISDPLGCKIQLEEKAIRLSHL